MSESFAKIYTDNTNDMYKFLIKNHVSKCGKVMNLDENIYDNQETQSKQDNEPLNIEIISGGAPSKEDKPERILYPSLNDIPDAKIKEFIDVCHLGYITQNPHSNAIFIIPDTTAMKAIKQDISTKLGEIDPNSPEGTIMIKTEQLLYKLFIIDVYGKDKSNASFEYRIPNTYPEDINEDVIYRRTSRFNDQVFFIKLNKKGIEVSVSQDMKNSVKCNYINSVGKYPRFVSFVFGGNLLPLISGKKDEKKAVKKNITIKKLFKNISKEYTDYEDIGYKFVGNMIKKFGVEKCKKYYSADLLQSSFAMISEFGSKTMIDNPIGFNKCGKYHSDMIKEYKPVVRNNINSTNLLKISSFCDKFVDSMSFSVMDKSKNKNFSDKSYFSKIQSAYQQICHEKKDINFVRNEIVGDIAYAIYDETSNTDLTLDMIENVKNSIMDVRPLTSTNLQSLIPYLSNYKLKGIIAQQFYPTLNITPKSKQFTPEIITGGNADEDDETLDLEFDAEPRDLGDIEDMADE